MQTKKLKTAQRKPSPAQLARREERIAALAHAIVTMIFASTGGAA